MNKSISIVYNLTGNFSSEKRAEVVWLSRHLLTDEQMEVICYLHGRNVRVTQWSIPFADVRDMVQQINYFSDTATVYIVPPAHFITNLESSSYINNIPAEEFNKLRFRKFIGFLNERGGFSFSRLAEHKVVSGRLSFETIFTNNELCYRQEHESFDFTVIPFSALAPAEN